MSKINFSIAANSHETPEKIRNDTPLPENIHLLSSNEIFELLTEHRAQLELYVTKFHPQKELQNEVLRLRAELQQLEQQFKELENERNNVQTQLEECRILESQYVKNWQDLHQKVAENYSDESLKAKLEEQIKTLDDSSGDLEVESKDITEMDQFLKEYIGIRTEYHVRREKLATWNAKGVLRM